MNIMYLTPIVVVMLVWIAYMTERLKNVPVEKIKALGDFFKNVIPSIPITGILKVFKKGKSEE